MVHPALPRRAFLQRAGRLLAVLPWWYATPAISIPQASGTRPAAAPRPSLPGVQLNVRDFGATGDGTTKDTLAIQQALDRCSLLGGGEVLVPAGSYLSGALTLHARTQLRLDPQATLLASPDLADYPVTQVRWEGRWVKGYAAFLSAWQAEDVAIVGPGHIVGNAAIRGRIDPANGMRHPALVEFTACRGVRMEDCLTSQNDMWSLHPVYCDDLVFRNLTVNGGADGLDVDSCRRVVIEGCTFATGDDCISLKSGRGEEGYTLHRPTEDVVIRNCTFTDRRWACIGIGSETSGGIRNVRVDHCKCLQAGTFAIYIKSRGGRGAAIEDITMTDLDVSGAKDGFLRINTLNSGKQDEFAVPGPAGIPGLRDLRFRNIRVTEEALLVDARSVHPEQPLHGLSLVDISGTCKAGILLANVQRAEIRDIHLTGLAGPLLSTSNVTGKGLTGAVALQPLPAPEAVPAPPTPYVLR